MKTFYMLLRDEDFMHLALKEAQKAYALGEVPVGAVVVCKQHVIAKGHNQVEQLQDATAHAEMVALTAAFNYVGSKYLPHCTLYVTLEPCLMCGGATYWSQLDKLVFAASDLKRGYRLAQSCVLHPRTKVTYNVLADTSNQLLTSFFHNLKH